MEKQKNNQTAVETKLEDETQYDEIQKVEQVERTDSYFDGKVLEWLGYRILAFIITAVTFGIANAWAEKLLIAYTIDHTVYNGKRLKFEGTGASLFVQKFKWLFLTIITLGIYGFWVPIKKEQWIVSNIHFEKEEFVKGDSYFDGGVLGIIGVNLFSKILTFISFGLLYPFVVCYRQRWFAKHTIINRKKIIFTGKSLSLIGNYLLWWFLCIITFGIFGLWLPIKIENWKAKNTHIKLKDEEEPKTSMVPAILGIILAIMLIVGVVTFTVNNVNFDKIMDDGIDFEEIFEKENKKPSRGNGQAATINTSNKNTNSNTNSNVSSNKNNNASSNKNNTSSNGNNSTKSNTNTVTYTTKDFKRYTTVTLIDYVATEGAPDHTSDLVASIEGNEIAISESTGAILIEGTNAKYLYKVSSGNKIDLYYITKNNELYVIHNPSSGNPNQTKTKVASSVAEFLGTENGKRYLKVLLKDGSTKNISY